MKFDIVRAWKDDNYRQALDNGDLSTLPASPVGAVELTNTELERVFGGGGGGGVPVTTSGGGYGHGGGVACPTTGCVGGSLVDHNASFALICEINIYSISILGNIALLGNVVQACIKG